MLWLVLFLVIVAAGALARGKRNATPPVPWLRDADPAMLVARDPLDALARYGTEADARRLEQEGVDLAGLGYCHPHHEAHHEG